MANPRLGLKAPFGARCFLTRPATPFCRSCSCGGLNALFGARCFLTLLDLTLASLEYAS